MRSHCSLYVDAGYLLASAATRVSGTSLRNGIHVEYRPLIEALIQQAAEVSGLPVLRVHWYDSAKNGVPDAQQERIGELPKVKLRLGRFGVDGQQKGVDLRIGLDLVAHARNGAADVFFLVSGDDDLTEAVEEAQVHGIQVVVMAVPNALGKPHAVSRHLVRAADELKVLLPSAIDATVMKVEVPRVAEPTQPIEESTARPSPLDLAGVRRIAPPSSSPAHAPAPATALAYTGSTGGTSHIAPGYADPDEYDEQIDRVVGRLVASLRKSATAEEEEALSHGRPSIPREIDRALLLDLSDALGLYDLNDSVRFRLRTRFWEHYDAAGS